METSGSSISLTRLTCPRDRRSERAVHPADNPYLLPLTLTHSDHTWFEPSNPYLGHQPTPKNRSVGYFLFFSFFLISFRDSKQKTGGPVSVHTSHCTHVKSHLTLRKRVAPCGCWWWVTVHQHTRGSLLKPTKMCSLKNGLWLLKYAGRLTPKMIKRWSKKT